MINYGLALNWPALCPDEQIGTPTGIAIDSNKDLFVFHRADRKWSSLDGMPKSLISANTLLKLDAGSGNIINQWGKNLFKMPHGLSIDHLNNIWVTDVGLHQVFKFSQEGILLLTIGEANVPGKDESHFNMPTDIAITNEGDVYISDGYGNNRIVKFSSTGQYLFEFGQKGFLQGELHLPHALALNDKQQLLVADRENNRIQLFDAAGKFLDEWSDTRFGKISSIDIDKSTNQIFAIDFITGADDKIAGSSIITIDPAKESTRIFGKFEGTRCWYHNVLVDDKGNIFVTDILNNKIYKFFPERSIEN